MYSIISALSLIFVDLVHHLARLTKGFPPKPACPFGGPVLFPKLTIHNLSFCRQKAFSL